MKQLVGNLWDFHDQGHIICITTNGSIKRNGCAVMGRGIARQAAQAYPGLPGRLGQALKVWGNRPFLFDDIRILTFPVKHQWHEQAKLDLIRLSALRIRGLLPDISKQIFCSRPGCGNGGLLWDDVRPVMESVFAQVDQFTIVDWSTEE